MSRISRRRRATMTGESKQWRQTRHSVLCRSPCRKRSVNGWHEHGAGTSPCRTSQSSQWRPACPKSSLSVMSVSKTGQLRRCIRRTRSAIHLPRCWDRRPGPAGCHHPRTAGDPGWSDRRQRRSRLPFLRDELALLEQRLAADLRPRYLSRCPVDRPGTGQCGLPGPGEGDRLAAARTHRRWADLAAAPPGRRAHQHAALARRHLRPAARGDLLASTPPCRHQAFTWVAPRWPCNATCSAQFERRSRVR